MNTESKSAKQKGKLSAFEPYALMAYDIAATFIAVFVASWGTQHWATFSEAAGACPAILVLALVNVVVFCFFHMYSSLWRYASISEAGRIVAAVISCSSPPFTDWQNDLRLISGFVYR